MPEVGQFSRGVVVRVMPYGAMVRLEDGCVGLVHISEIDERFVQDVGDYLVPNTRVVVKIINLKEDGRYEFSIKKARNEKPFEEEIEEFGSQEPIFHEPYFDNRTTRVALEEKLREFMADATDRLTDVRRHNDHKLGLRRR